MRALLRNSPDRAAAAERPGWIVPGRLAAALALAVGGGCLAPSYRALRPESEIAALRELREEEAERDARATLVPTVGSSGYPLRVAVHETGQGDRDRIVVLVHGLLSDHRVWRFVGAAFAGEADVLAVDLPGCGASDAPDPEALGPEGYSPSELARRVLEALRDRISGRPATARIALVGHSLGGAVVLRMLGSSVLREEFAEVLDRVDAAALLAPLDVAVEKPHPKLVEIAELTGFEVGLGAFFGTLRERVARDARRDPDAPGSAPREDVDRLVEILSDAPRRRAAQAMIRQAVPWQDGGPDWPRIEALVADYAKVDVPCLLLWGARDETLPLSMGYKLALELPEARLHVLPRSRHSLPVERPRDCARLIRRFLADARVEPAGTVTWETGADSIRPEGEDSSWALVAATPWGR